MTNLIDSIRSNFHVLDANSIPANKSTPPLDAISALDLEISQAAQQYCQHSGKPLQRVDDETIANLITIHGRKTTLEILYYHQKQVSLEWFWLNDDGLSNLSLHRPAEYFVYTCSKLMQNCTIQSELMRLHQAAATWQSMQSIDDAIINPINELMRRLLANYSLESLQKYLNKFRLKRVDAIAATMETLTQFELELSNLLKNLLDKKSRIKAIENGLQVYRLQQRITALSEMELEINQELNDFIDLEDIKLPSFESKQMKRTRDLKMHELKQANAQKLAKPRYTSTPNVKKPAELQGFKLKLNLGGK